MFEPKEWIRELKRLPITLSVGSAAQWLWSLLLGALETLIIWLVGMPGHPTPFAWMIVFLTCTALTFAVMGAARFWLSGTSWDYWGAHKTKHDRRTQKETQTEAAFTLLKPPFGYELNFDPQKSLQIVTNVNFVPSGQNKPDKRIPIFFVKNFTGEVLRDVVVRFDISHLPIERAVQASTRLSKFKATIISDFIPSPVGSPGPHIPHKALSMRHKIGNSISESTYPYERVGVCKIDFIDPFDERSVCSQVTNAGLEIFLASMLVGARLGTTVTAEIGCSVSAKGYSTIDFRITVIARSSRGFATVNGIVQNDTDDAKASLKFEVQPVAK